MTSDGLLIFGLFLPLCSWLMLLIHELSHWLCFKLFGFYIKELRIGLFLLKFEKNFKTLKIVDSGFFCGFCTIKEKTRERKRELIFSLLAGGVSGLLISIVSFILMILNIASKKWSGVLSSLICVGLCSFYVTLISPKGADRKLIDKIIKEETEK